MIAALFVDEAGPYASDPRFDPWGVTRDARNFDGEAPVVAHPPCQRWGRFYMGRPTRAVEHLGDDGGCFHVGLSKVRANGGVLEHPKDSRAWEWFNLPRPPAGGGWSAPDAWGGRSCRIDQSAYGHPAQKPTWLYAVLPEYPALDWRQVKTDRHVEKMSSTNPWRWRTPDALRGVLHDLAASCHGWRPKMAPHQRRLLTVEGRL